MRIQYLLSGALLALTLALILEGALGLGLLIAWLIGINFLALVFYRVDKLNAPWADENPKQKDKNVRIPEFSLLGLAAIGGSPGAILAMVIPPHHKTTQSSFKSWLAVILAAQTIAVVVFWEQIPWV